MYMHTCLHHAHSQFGSIQVHPLVPAPCQSFHKLRQPSMQQCLFSPLARASFSFHPAFTWHPTDLSMQPIHSFLHQLHLLLNWAQHQMKIMQNWEVQTILRKLWGGSHHTKANARSSKQRIANWRKTSILCSNNARIGKRNASVLPKSQSRGTRSKSKCMKFHLQQQSQKQPESIGCHIHLHQQIQVPPLPAAAALPGASLQAQSPCNQKWQLVNHSRMPSSCSKMPRGDRKARDTKETDKHSWKGPKDTKSWCRHRRIGLQRPKQKHMQCGSQSKKRMQRRTCSKLRLWPTELSYEFLEFAVANLGLEPCHVLAL